MSMKARRQEGEPPSRMQRIGEATGINRVADTESPLRRFIRDTRAELRKVTWPTREQATNLTVLVLAVSAAVGAFLGGLDYVFSQLFALLIGRA